MEARREELDARFEPLWRGVVLEPRGHDALVGALLTPPVSHGAVGGRRLLRQRRPALDVRPRHDRRRADARAPRPHRAGPVRLDTPVGPVGRGARRRRARHDRERARPAAIAPRRRRGGPGHRAASSATWPTAATGSSSPSAGASASSADNRERLRAVDARDPAGPGGAGRARARAARVVDHVILYGPAGAGRRGQPELRDVPGRRVRPVALRDRHVGEDGVAPRPRTARGRASATARSRSREASSPAGSRSAAASSCPRIQGRAFVTGRATLYFDPRDPFRHGLAVGGRCRP